MEEIFAPSYARTFIQGRFYRLFEKPDFYIFMYLRKEGIHHFFREIHGKWTVSYTDSQLIGKKIEEFKMKKVFICTPYTKHNMKHDILQARKSCLHALKKGCMPYAPQLYSSQFLMPEQEVTAWINQMWLSECSEFWVIGEKITAEMQRDIETAEKLGIPVVRKHEA